MKTKVVIEDAENNVFAVLVRAHEPVSVPVARCLNCGTTPLTVVIVGVPRAKDGTLKVGGQGFAFCNHCHNKVGSAKTQQGG